MLFGLVYSMTVAKFPKGIFVLAGTILFIALILLAGVSPQRAIGIVKRKKVAAQPWEARDTERGRSRVGKDLSSSFAGPSTSSNDFGRSNISASCIHEHSAKSGEANASASQ